MFNRIVLAAALLVAPLVLMPTSVAAQESGQETAATSAANGLATSASNGRPTDLPPGMEDRSGDLPAGIMMTRDVPEVEEPTTGGDECIPEPWFNPDTMQWELKPCS